MYELEETYWNGKGKYQELCDVLWDWFVPDRGSCKLEYMEMFRIVMRIQYDYYNNGGCNLDDYYYDEHVLENPELEEMFEDTSLYDVYVRTIKETITHHNAGRGNLDYMDDIFSEKQLKDFEIAQQRMIDNVVLYAAKKALKEWAAIRKSVETED